jgi:3-oxoacyl-[acyl-carrier protein] reductase
LEDLGVRVIAEQCDVASTLAAAAMVKSVKENFGRIDYLVNNAGITRDNLILRMKEEDWDAVIDTNLKGAWNFAKAALRIMLRQEGGGSVLNISSISGRVGMMGQSNYSASKAGMIGLTKALAKEVASRSVTVNALALGLVATDMAGALDENYRAKLLEQIPLRRFAEANEVARIACFYCRTMRSTSQVRSYRLTAGWRCKSRRTRCGNFEIYLNVERKSPSACDRRDFNVGAGSEIQGGVSV